MFVFPKSAPIEINTVTTDFNAPIKDVWFMNSRVFQLIKIVFFKIK